ncbi:MAG: ATP-dependent DNA helicase RecG [Candidatus Omnitrophica bacterium]|nr:ATP-dependent DNA helicase RecG [Candidatus Omnitrophota bacterium]
MVSTESARKIITLRTPLRYLKGVGPERYRVLMKLGLYVLADAFYFFPRRYEDRAPIKTVSELGDGEKQCVEGVVAGLGLIRIRNGRSIFRVVLSDGKGVLFALWFNQPYLAKVFMPKSRVIFYGKAERQGRHLQMVHPEYEMVPEGEGPKERIHSGRIAPIYPLTQELHQKSIRQLLFHIVREQSFLLADFLPAGLRKRQGLADTLFAFREIHFPGDFSRLERAYERLVFDEFFLMQTAVQMKKKEMETRNEALSHKGGKEEIGRWIGGLEFSLTAGQRQAIQDILSDMKRDRPMNRLVQGDVGSGKTVVAAAALFFTAANSFQGALMAPTEVLAQQHYFNLCELLEPFGITCGYLAQSLSEDKREEALQGIAEGRIQVVVGTHALIQERVRFARLGLAVVDEQHKFGVFQRANLKEKMAGSAHFLLLTATPIPRTLAMTLYGDLDISTIAERPKDRRPVRTFWVGEDRRTEVYALLDKLLAEGRQAYVLCPLVQAQSAERKAQSVEAEASLKSVAAVHRELSEIFAHRKVGILHGRMKADEKKKVMQDFKERRIELLVSTVVIEVGIDVPNAVMMIVENAERFGLAQLHQLRGRVGRGSEESFCVLFSESSSPETVERLSAFEETESGFEIAEKDLGLRGGGDILGERQHGLPKLRIGDLVKDMAILERAKDEAKRVVGEDPKLGRPEHRLLKRALVERFQVSSEKLTALA